MPHLYTTTDTVVNNNLNPILDNVDMPKRTNRTATPFGKRVQGAAALVGAATPISFARRLLVSPQTAHKWWMGDTPHISAADLLKIADSLNVSGRWLLTGKGSPVKRDAITPDEIRVLDIYRNLPAEWRDDWVSQGVKIVERLGTTPSKANPFPKAKQ